MEQRRMHADPLHKPKEALGDLIDHIQSALREMDPKEELNRFGRLLIWMSEDVLRGTYRSIESETLFVLGATALYVLIPEEKLKPLIGEKTWLKTGLLCGYSLYKLHTELRRYESFLMDQQESYASELGSIRWYRHRTAFGQEDHRISLFQEHIPKEEEWNATSDEAR